MRLEIFQRVITKARSVPALLSRALLRQYQPSVLFGRRMVIVCGYVPKTMQKGNHRLDFF
jgi:hypothetical protein